MCMKIVIMSRKNTTYHLSAKFFLPAWRLCTFQQNLFLRIHLIMCNLESSEPCRGLVWRLVTGNTGNTASRNPGSCSMLYSLFLLEFKPYNMPNRSRIQRFAILLLLLFMAWFTRCAPSATSARPAPAASNGQ
jgi:hypothetical protein